MGSFKYLLVSLFILGYVFSDVQSLTCWSCNSNVDPDCAQNPGSLTEQTECQEPTDKCEVAILTDDSTYRGCSSELPTEITISAECEEDLCNGEIYPADRLQCHQCSGADCLAAQTQGNELPCKLYQPDDACFTDVIDETDVQRGCTSDSSYVPGDYAKFCKTSGCNSDPGLSEFSCAVCDSTEDGLSCVYGTVSGSECSVTTENTCSMQLLLGRLEHCFTYHKGEHVVRGCSRDSPQYVNQTNYIRECILEKCNDECIEPPQCYSCSSATEPYCQDQSVGNLTVENCPVGTTSCHTCRDEAGTTHRGCGEFEGSGQCASCWNDPGCNNKKMLRCYSCSSENDPNCDTWENPENIDKVICNGNCIATLRNGIVERGCQSNSFDCQPSLTCKSCTEDDCNSGRVPDESLRCYQCGENDADCNNDQSYQLAPSCPIVEDETDKCYMFVTNDNKMVRGCTTDMRYNECTLMPAGKCVTCSGDGCNSQAIIGKLQCIKCDSNTDPSCKTGLITRDDECSVTSLQFCEVEVPFSEYEYCFTYQYGERVIRGCSKEDTAISSQIKYVRECRFDNCNNECIDSPKCYSCDSSQNQNCADDVFMTNQVSCNAGDISCYTCRDSGKVIRRGCGSGDTFGQCESCWDDDGCNNKPMLECYSCNSQVDKKCATWTDVGTINTMICNGLCIATLRDGYVVRGCQSNSFDCPSSETCVRCDKDNCNSGLVPTDRMMCHQCDESNPDCYQDKESSEATACSVYKSGDQCFLFMDDNNKMVRGCVSDERYDDCSKNKDRCITCSEPGCNSMGGLVEPALECAKCKGGEECAWAQTESSKCENSRPYFESESCYIARSSDGTISRGCSLDDPNACTSATCTTCSTNGCNDVNRVYQSCLQCTGTGDNSCVVGQDVKGTTCSEPVQPYDTRGCYAQRDGDTVKRGCLYSLNNEQKESCEKDQKNCQVCYDQDCNTKDLRSHAPTLGAFSGLLLAVVAYLIKG